MRTRISELIIGDSLRYTVEKKNHWWERWHYIMDGKYPRLFSQQELIKFKMIKEE